MKKEIPLSVPNLNIEIVENLRECIETGWVSTGGRFIAEFERKFADYVNVGDAVSTQSGTASLHIALRVLGIKEEDAVIVPTLTFVAAVNPVRYTGAAPIFMDCDETLCMDPGKLQRYCEEECDFDGSHLKDKQTGRKVSALILVHVFGNLAKIEAIKEIADRYHIRIVEDATEALGSRYTKGKYKGCLAGTIGDFGAYSFNANKIITTGGGGMLVSNNKDDLDQSRYLSITAKDDSLYFVHNDVGYNYRMLNLQAALGVSQIDELDQFIQIKKRNYNLYRELLNETDGLSILPFSDSAEPNYWFYSLYVDKKRFGTDRDELMHELIAEGIQCRPVWKLIHTLNPYKDYPAYQIEKAFDYEKNIINLPCSTNLKPEDIEYISERIKDKSR